MATEHDTVSKRLYFLIAGLLLLLYLVNGFLAIPKLSVTYDEADHLNYGIRMLKGQPRKLVLDDGSVMPISALNAIPRGVEQVFRSGLQKTDGGVSDIMHGRYVTVIIGLLIGFFICRWSTEMFGRKAGLLSLLLFVLCPNLNANAHLVTTDVYTALFVLITAYFFYRFVRFSGWTNFIAFSLAIGFSQAVKQSLLLLFFFFAVCSLVVLLRRDSLLYRFRLNLLRLVVFCALVLLSINLCYLFDGTGMTLSAYDFKSEFFKDLQEVKLLSRVPLPLPEPFVQGFDFIRFMLGLGSGHKETSPQSYLFGFYFTGNGPWYYYPCVILFKTPLSVLVLLLLLLWKRKNPTVNSFWRSGFPLAVALFFVLSVMVLNTSQHSIRHLVLIYPLLYVSVGRVFIANSVKNKILTAALMVYSIATYYFYYPNLIAYTNEILWNKTNVYKTIASTNIDFAQGHYFAADYLKNHKNVEMPGETPKAGNFILDINTYLDLWNTGKYRWLRSFAPDSHVNHCYLLFNITEQDLKAKGYQ